MHFEHIVVINDPLEPLAEPLSREQVWNGLMWRAEQPTAFQPEIESCAILRRAPDRLERELDFGNFRMRDTVRWAYGQWVSFESSAEGERPGGQLTITIEEPSAAVLLLRFTYQTTLDDRPGSEAAEFAGYVKAAYRELDIDTARRIRERAVRGSAH